jgi:hypothetical protein
MIYYELWNIKSGNAVGDSDTEAQALALVREAIRRHSRGYVDKLALGCEDENGDGRAIASGAALADLAEAAAPASHLPAHA